jgi:predicted thioesterase
MMKIEAGLSEEFELEVREEDTASASSGGSLPHVLSTPRMIGWMESAASRAVAGSLEPGQSTVGTAVNIRHMAATPVGVKVRVRAELIEVDRRRLLFKVEAWDTVEMVGSGEHERFIIDRQRFDERVAEKKAGI